MDAYWLEQIESDLPPENAWLSASEAHSLSAFRIPKRRDDWRLGRWTAKRAIAAYLHLPASFPDLARIEIRPAPSGAPEVFLADTPAPVALSLSHSNGRAFCAVAPPGLELGCDLEQIEPHSDAFIADYFTTEEQQLVAQTCPEERPALLALFWSAKESTLKALHEGLRLDTRSVIVSPAEGPVDVNGWGPLQVLYTGERIFRGWWQRADSMMRTIVADPPPNSPMRLDLPPHLSDRASRCA